MLTDNLGSGAFGIVKKAELFEPDTGMCLTVAVKMLKGMSRQAIFFIFSSILTVGAMIYTVQLVQ